MYIYGGNNILLATGAANLMKRLITYVDSKGWFENFIPKIESEGWFGYISQVMDD